MGKKMLRGSVALFLFFFLLLPTVPGFAQERVPLRVARVPMQVLWGGALTREGLEALETKMGRALHVPLNGVLQWVEYLPEEETLAALRQVMAELRQGNSKARLKDAMKPLAEKLGADLVVCPVIEYYHQDTYWGFWNGETILHSDVRISLMGYQKGKRTPFSETESRFYRGSYSSWGLADVLAEECMDKVIEETGIRGMIRGGRDIEGGNRG